MESYNDTENRAFQLFMLAEFELLLSNKNIRTYSNGTIVGDLPDGRTINIHPSTTLGGTPSVEIYDPVIGKSIKIRY